MIVRVAIASFLGESANKIEQALVNWVIRVLPPETLKIDNATHPRDRHNG